MNRTMNLVVGAALAMLIAAVDAPAATLAGAVGKASDLLIVPPPKTGRARPLIAVIADNAGSETTDFTIPYGVLKESGVADMVSLSTRPGPVQLQPTLRIRTDFTLAEFDASTPRGADIVIVPAMIHDKENPEVVHWIREQYAKGSTVVSICTGAFVLARAGLFDGKKATSHWGALGDLEKEFPNTHWVRDRRYVQDGRVISTSGVTASIPVSLALVEAIAGHTAALRTANRLGVADWSATHHTPNSSLNFGRFSLYAANYLAFWRHETVEVPVADGFDEIGLALVSDAWKETFLANVATTRADGRPVISRHGLILLPDAAPADGSYVLHTYSGPSLRTLDHALSDIDRRYGVATGNVVALSMEYPRR